MRVSWSPVYDNGSPLTSYSVYIRQHGTETYSLETSDCDGASESVLDLQSCTILLLTLEADPFFLVGGDSIWAKVSASNFYGESVLSNAGNNAYYTTEPDAPLNLAEDVSKRTSTKVGLTWEDAVNNGGMPVIDYRIKQRVAEGTYSYIAIGLTQKSFTPSGL